MQVTPLIFNNIQNKNYSQKSKMTVIVNRNDNSKKSFVDGREYYGRYIAFGNATSNVTEKIATLQKFLADEIEPFLKKHKKLNNQTLSIHQKSEEMFDIFSQKRDDFRTTIREGFELEKIDFVAEHLQKPLIYEQNIQEYNYLRGKSQKYFVSDDVQEYATRIASEMHKKTPYLSSFSPIMSQYYKTAQDIKNGLVNLSPESMFPKLSAKSEEIYKAETTSLLSIFRHIDVSSYFSRVSEFLAQPQGTREVVRFNKYFEEIGKIRNYMAQQEEYLPIIEKNVAKAQELLDNNGFTQEEVDTAFQLLEKERLRIIDKQVNRFRRYFDKHYEFRWDKAHDSQTNAILAKQNELNGELSQKIDHSEYRFFNDSEGYVLSGEPPISQKAIYGEMEDLPF